MMLAVTSGCHGSINPYLLYQLMQCIQKGFFKITERNSAILKQVYYLLLPNIIDNQSDVQLMMMRKISFKSNLNSVEY